MKSKKALQKSYIMKGNKETTIKYNTILLGKSSNTIHVQLLHKCRTAMERISPTTEFSLIKK